MPSQFRNATDYIKRGPRAAAKALAFAAKVTNRTAGRGKQPQPVLAAPAANAAEWEGVFKDTPCVFLIGIDDHRLHAAVAPEGYVANQTQPYQGLPDIARLVDDAVARPANHVLINARYLLDAIHPDAAEVSLSLPTEGNQAVVVTSLTETGAQLAWAMIMPMSLGRDGTHISRAPRLATAEAVVAEGVGDGR